MPNGPDPGFELIPAEDDPITADADLDAAVASALDDPFARDEESEVPIPFGRTWEFDWDAGRFRRHGTSPAVVVGEHSLHQWLLAAVNTALGAHPIFSDSFGMERLFEPLGEGPMAASEAISDLEERLREAWTEHDRVSDVVDLDAAYDAVEGILYIRDVVVVVDEDERLRLGPVSLATVSGA